MIHIRSLLDSILNQRMFTSGKKMPGGSHIDMVYVYVPAFGVLFYKIWYSDQERFDHRQRSVIIWAHCSKKHPIWANWVFFVWNWYNIDGWLSGDKRGIAKVKILKSGRHIHLHNFEGTQGKILSHGTKYTLNSVLYGKAAFLNFHQIT